MQSLHEATACSEPPVILTTPTNNVHPATKQLDSRIQPKPLSRNLTKAHHVHAPGKQSQNPEYAHTRHHQSHTTSPNCTRHLTSNSRTRKIHFATRITRCDRSFLTWTDLHTQPEFEAQHLYTRLKSPAQEPGEFRHVFHTQDLTHDSKRVNSAAASTNFIFVPPLGWLICV